MSVLWMTSGLALSHLHTASFMLPSAASRNSWGDVMSVPMALGGPILNHLNQVGWPREQLLHPLTGLQPTVILAAAASNLPQGPPPPAWDPM